MAANTREYARAWYRANRERVLAEQKACYPSVRERKIASAANWTAANPEKAKANKARWYEKHKEEQRVKTAERYQQNRVAVMEGVYQWRAAHLELVRRYSLMAQDKRRGHKLGLPGNLTFIQWEAIKVAYKGRCAYCGEKVKKLTMDHVVPVTKGGMSTPQNIVPACKPCNSAKGNRAAPVLPAIRLMV